MASTLDRHGSHDHGTNRPDARRRSAPAGPAGLLGLQRSAGNQAVQALIAAGPPALLVQRWADEPEAQAVLAGIGTASADELRELVRGFDHPEGTGDHVAIEGLGRSLPVATADASELRQRAAQRLVERLMSELAGSRIAVVTRMQTLTGAARRRAMNDLHTAEAPRLQELRRLTGGTPDRWQHPDPAVQDAVLAAIQLEAVYRAESRLADVTQAHTDAATACGMSMTDDWCGFFVAESFMQSSLDRDLRAGFFHTENVVDYFRYDYARVNLSRIKKWIWADGSWRDIRTYHEQRGSLRTWTDAHAIHGAGGAALDIRPGDVALIDNRGSERPDHIVMVDSYDPTTHALMTIGGNDSGYTIDPTAQHAPPAGESARDRGKREALEAGTGQNLRPGGSGGVGFGIHDLGDQPAPGPLEAAHGGGTTRPTARVYGVGRPSAVDFEDHFYDATTVAHPPAAAPAHA